MCLKAHEPIRSCVVCRKKDLQVNLLRFQVLDNELIFDLKRKLPGRGFYVCDNNQCIEELTIWKKKKLKRLQTKQKRN